MRRSTFVLVHGAWHGGWCYSRVAAILRERGHCVFAPTLTGLGERSHLAGLGLINCSTHIRDIVNVFEWERLSDVVLCGHSYGGLVIGGVADIIPHRVASLVYLDACIPRDGQSAFDTAEPNRILQILKGVAEHGGYMVPPPPAEHFNVNPADRAMVDALCTPHPLATCVERLKITGACMSISKKTYVFASNWKAPFALEYERARKDRSWIALEISCGQDVMLDAPDRLAEILLNARPDST